MSGSVFLDPGIVELALSEVETARKSLSEDAVASLAQEVVRRVSANLRPAFPADLLPLDDEVDALCMALISDNPQAALDAVTKAQRKGASYDAICQSYLGAAASRLGEWWEQDRVSFHQVTTGAGRIYAILRSLRLLRLQPMPDIRRYCVFAAVPGETHTLGITIATDLARDYGWDIDLFVGRDHDELVQEIERRQAAIVGLSASSRRSLPALVKLMVALRISNPDVRILVCGQICALNINLIGITGADATASDFPTALDQMDILMRPGQGFGKDQS